MAIVPTVEEAATSADSSDDIRLDEYYSGEEEAYEEDVDAANDVINHVTTEENDQSQTETAPANVEPSDKNYRFILSKSSKTK